MNRESLRNKLLKLIPSQKATAFYVNGPPASGKSELLRWLEGTLPDYVRACTCFGPYSVNVNNIAQLRERLVADLIAAGFDLDTSPPTFATLGDIWRSVNRGSSDRLRRTFICFLDVDASTSDIAIAALQRFFSEIRATEFMLGDGPNSIHHLVVGQWSTLALKQYYEQIHLSFSYSENRNHCVWAGLSACEMGELQIGVSDQNSASLYINVLHELTAGHPGAALDIIRCLKRQTPTIAGLLDATKTAVEAGQVAKRLREAWRSLPRESKLLALKLMRFGRVSAGSSEAFLPLSELGLVQIKNGSKGASLAFSSWYFELAMRRYAEDFGGDETDWHTSAHIVPSLSHLNEAGYAKINELENVARNLLAQMQIRLSPKGSEPFRGQYIRSDGPGVRLDFHARAEQWRKRYSTRGAESTLTPLIAFCTTRDLSDMFKELATRLRAPHWTKLAKKLNDLAMIRDSVMHNQLIDDQSLKALDLIESELLDSINAALANYPYSAGP